MDLKYGKTTVELPAKALENSQILASSVMPGPITADAMETAFRSALDTPSAGIPLSSRMKADASTTIVISDKTRNYGVHDWLTLLIDYCNRCGVPDEKITVVTATGAHSGHTDEEKRNLVGVEVAARISIIDHDCLDAASLVELGMTSRGTRVKINRIAAEAENLIITGIVMPHYYAGFTGGRKSILPGVSAHETIFKNHSLNLAPGGGTEKRARTMTLDGNPIHEDMVEALGMVDVTFSINVITAKGGAPALFFSGDPGEAHEKACERAKGIMGVPIKGQVDWVIASCGGFPKDISMYQSHKSLDNSFRALKKGGVLVLLAECSEGLGPDGFLKWFEYGSIKRMEELLREEYVVMGHTALRTLEKAQACKAFLLSSLEDDIVRKIGMIPIKNIEEALGKIDFDKPGIVIPDAANTVPVTDI